MDKVQNKTYKYLLIANNATAINFDDWNKPDNALYYNFKNLKLLKHVKDTLPFTFVFNNIGNTLLKQKKSICLRKSGFCLNSRIIRLLGIQPTKN